MKNPYKKQNGESAKPADANDTKNDTKEGVYNDLNEDLNEDALCAGFSQDGGFVITTHRTAESPNSDTNYSDHIRISRGRRRVRGLKNLNEITLNLFGYEEKGDDDDDDDDEDDSMSDHCLPDNVLCMVMDQYEKNEGVSPHGIELSDEVLCNFMDQFEKNSLPVEGIIV